MFDFQCINLLGSNHSFEYLGNSFNYRRVESISMEGILLDQSLTGIWTGVKGFNCFPDWDDISINGCSIGSGRFISASFQGGPDLFKKPFTVDLEFYHSGDLNYFTGQDYSYMDFSKVPWDHIQSFNQDFTFSSKRYDAEKTYNRTASFQLISGKNVDISGVASTMANMLFTGTPSFSCFNTTYPSFYSTGKKNRTETADLINNSFSFSEEFISNGGNTYSTDETLSFSIDEQGVINVQERGTVKGLTDYTAARTAYTSIAADAKDKADVFRKEAIKVFYGPPTSCGQLYETSRTRKDDSCAAKIDYTFSFTTDPKYYQDNYFWSYSHNLATNDQGITTISEQGLIKCADNQSSGSALSTYLTYSGSTGIIYNRMVDSYENYLLYKSDGGISGTSINPVSKSVSNSVYGSSTKYNWSYSDDPSLVEDDNYGQLRITNSDTPPVHNFNTFPIFNKRVIKQPSNQGTVGQFNNSISIAGKSVASTDYLFTLATGSIVKPTGTHTAYLTDLEWSYDPKNFKFDLTSNYNYIRYKKKGDVTLK